MVATIAPAKVTIDKNRVKSWRCPNCDQKLGEILGNRVVVKAGSITLFFSLRNDPEQSCFRCGTSSSLKPIEL